MDADEVIMLFWEGVPIPEIATQVNAPYSSVWALLDRHGLAGRQPSGPSEAYDAAVQDYLEGPQTVIELCLSHGISTRSLYAELARRGIPRKRPTRRRRVGPRKALTVAEWEGLSEAARRMLKEEYLKSAEMLKEVIEHGLL